MAGITFGKLVAATTGFAACAAGGAASGAALLYAEKYAQTLPEQQRGSLINRTWEIAQAFFTARKIEDPLTRENHVRVIARLPAKDQAGQRTTIDAPDRFLPPSAPIVFGKNFEYQGPLDDGVGKKERQAITKGKYAYCPQYPVDALVILPCPCKEKGNPCGIQKDPCADATRIMRQLFRR